MSVNGMLVTFDMFDLQVTMCSLRPVLHVSLATKPGC